MTLALGIASPVAIAKSSVDDRIAVGKAARKERPRAAIAAWEPRSDRPSPISLLTDQEEVRVSELLPIRHSRMSTNAFSFYRGAAALMAYDLGTTDCSGLAVQLCGDAHVSNFGLFAAPDRALVFDINDFDETHVGPFEWDVIRMTTSLMIAARENGYAEKDQDQVVSAAASAYRLSMVQYAGMDNLAIFYDRVDASFLLALAKDAGGKAAQKQIEGVLAQARKRDRWSALRKLTEKGPQGLRFIDNPPIVARLADDNEFVEVLHEVYELYRSTLLADREEITRRYRIINTAHKVVGVGSVGLRAFVFLMQGRDEDDVFILQAKQAVPSVLERYTTQATVSPGERVVRGQRLMQAATDIFLGHVTGPLGRSYYLRQLRDMKWSADIPTLSVANMSGYATLCGRALARAHARSGDAIAISAYLGGSDRFDGALIDFARRYSEQNSSDFSEFKQAIADGSLPSTDDEQASVLTSIDTGSIRLEKQAAMETHELHVEPSATNVGTSNPPPRTF